MPIVIETLNEFHDRHSVNGKGINIGGWFFYPDGAELEDNPMGARWEPVEGSEKQVDNIEKYWRERRDRVLERYHQTQQDLLTCGVHVARINGTPPPDKETIAHLLDPLEREVIHCRKELAKATAKVEQLPREQARRARDAARYANMERCDATALEILRRKV